MALEGNLRDFSLEHVFQLINTGKKTGTLHIARGDGDAEAFVYFRKGKIFGAVSNFNRKPIGERLVQAGQITEADLEAALSEQKTGSQRRKLGQILVAEGLITTDILKQFVREQIQSTVFDLLPWEEGEFQFNSDLPPVEDMGLLVSAKKVLSEGNQRLDEWDKVKEKVPSLGAVFEVNEMAVENTSVTLTALHLKLLRHVDGERTVTDLALLMKISEFETSRTLYDLADAAIVKLKEEKSVEDGAGPAAATKGAAGKMPVTPVGAAVTDESIDFSPDLDDEHLDGIVSEENAANRAAFVQELSAVTRDGSGLRFTLTRKMSLKKKIDLDKQVKKNEIDEAIELFSR